MRVLMVSSEAVPYVKTGGLGDVVGSLARAFAENIHHVVLVLPYYRSIRQNRLNLGLKPALSPLAVSMGNTTLRCRVWEISPQKNLHVFFVEYDDFFNRSSIYDEGSKPYLDNAERYAFLCKAALDLCLKTRFSPEIVHIHDWQTALVSYYLKSWYWNEPLFRKTASILTIHNMGYQGHSRLEASPFIGLNWMQVRSDEFEDQGMLNLLKGGIFYADQITTVSPTYAREILSEPGGCGLSFYLQRRQNDVVGILNGIDTEEWNPQTDPLIPANYSVKDPTGKALCKTSLQKRFNLAVDSGIPVFGIVSRFAYQKGFDLLKTTIDEILDWSLQLIVLGSGDAELSAFFSHLAKRYPDKVALYIGFQPELAHLIEAGSDFFIMPSLYEPCGLNQIYSMLYGSLPIVRATGGLNDTVENFNEEENTGTGFVFYDISPGALKNTMGWALSIWYNQRIAYEEMQLRAMDQDFSWKKAVRQYELLFRKAYARRRHWS